MISYLGKVTTYRWKIVDLLQKHDNAKKNRKKLFSEKFALTDRESVKFALFLHEKHIPFDRNSFGVMLKNSNVKTCIVVNIKFWFENEADEEFGKTTSRFKI